MKKSVVIVLCCAFALFLSWCRNQVFLFGSTIIEIKDIDSVDTPIVTIDVDKNIIREWDNYLPIFDSLTLSLPWSGNEIQALYPNIFNANNLTVKVTATNAKDIDGGISYYKWYYYYKDDPDRKLEVKVTPGAENYTYFQLKGPWEYGFWVKIYDNKDGETISEELLWGWPTVLLSPSSTNIDIPIVTLKSNRTSVEVWDEVTFNVVAKVISDRPDFVQERVFKYDFDGDWNIDLITKDDQVTYIYEKPSADGYIPRVSVAYRWNVWTANWWSIVVRD